MFLKNNKKRTCPKETESVENQFLNASDCLGTRRQKKTNPRNSEQNLTLPLISVINDISVRNTELC